MKNKNAFSPALPFFRAAGDILTTDEAKNLFLNGLDMLPMEAQEETLSTCPQSMRNVGNGFFVPCGHPAPVAPPASGAPLENPAVNHTGGASSFPANAMPAVPGTFNAAPTVPGGTYGAAPAPSGNPFRKAGGLDGSAPLAGPGAERPMSGGSAAPGSFESAVPAPPPSGSFAAAPAAPRPFAAASALSGQDGQPSAGAGRMGTPAAAWGAAAPGATRGAAPIKLRSSTAAALQVRIKDKTVQNGKKTILRDVNFDVMTGDFVLILGGSGAGKTTLIRSILGESKANGNILLNGSDLYKNFRTMKSQIGIVPQFLTLRLNDTVRNTVTDAAYIRLAGAFRKQDIQRRVDTVLEKAGIKPLENSLIGDLSGGQKKRVSVAVQLVGSQSVFICDEPDSGLDAAARGQLMELLGEISKSGKIVMVISHYPDDAVNFISKVVVLAKSNGDKAGHVCYDGDVAGALKTFGVGQLQEIMKEVNPPHEGGKGLADEYIERWRRVRV